MDKSKNYFLGSFPSKRMRRLRQFSWSREMVSENTLSPKNLILPLFISATKKSTLINTMPGIKRLCVDEIIDKCHEAKELKIPAIALFPETQKKLKNSSGSESINPDNLVCRTVRRIKDKTKNLGIICDIALDPYTSSGHDGIIENKEIHNDKTIDLLCKQALINAQAGCSIIAPSDMMDGRIGSIRSILDKHNYQNIMIMSYAAKYNSAFYGPFRDAIKSEKNLGPYGKKSYQMDSRNSDEALTEVALDIQEGADMIMIKPGMPYLDVIYKVKQTFKVPTFTYQVSGEYSMLKLAINKKYLSKELAILETLNCFIRSGADGILTYFALDAAKFLKKG